MRNAGIPIASLLLAAALAAGSAPVQAQPTPPAPRNESMGGPEQRRELNLEQARFAQEQLRQDAEAKAEYQAKLKAVEEAKAKIAADQAAAKAAYEAALAKNKAEAERITSEHDATVAKWKADVAACEKGDRSRCAKK